VDLEVFGTGLHRYTTGFPESLDLLLDALSGKPTIAADGPLFRFREVAMVPRPARPVPVWVAATLPSTVDIAAVRGLPLLLGMYEHNTAKAAAIDRYAQTAIAAGRHPGTPAHASAHLVHVADTVEDAEADLRATLPGWLARTREYARIDDSQPTHRDLDAYLDHLLAAHPVGPPERCVERLTDTLTTTGVRRLLLMVEATGRPDRTLETIARLGAEVIPKIRAAC
jgi:alkanesulfonate monooxygenase SsuD/methylene tetrahydromethanopterin reductase-like flavin-dependent oxidoreductase (luciferase family)